jgi:hypothetical protein
MANNPIAKPKRGKRELNPYYCGITEGKDLKGTAYRHTHYVLIEKLTAKQLGIKADFILKFGGTDSNNRGVITQSNRKPSKKGGKLVTAKRYITQCSKSITAYCKGVVKNSKGKDVSETYSIGFPSNVPLRLIIKFFKTNCLNVIRIGTGGNFYQIR